MFPDFHYGNAITATAGGEILLDAADFDLALFDEKTKFHVVVVYLGKIHWVVIGE